MSNRVLESDSFKNSERRIVYSQDPDFIYKASIDAVGFRMFDNGYWKRQHHVLISLQIGSPTFKMIFRVTYSDNLSKASSFGE